MAQEYQNFMPGEVIFHEGDGGFTMYVIAEGQVKVQTGQGHKSVTLAELGPGEVLGEMALVTDEPRSATAVAVTQTKLRAYQVDELVKMLEENPGIAVRIIELLAERLRKTNQLLTEATTTAS